MKKSLDPLLPNENPPSSSATDILSVEEFMQQFPQARMPVPPMTELDSLKEENQRLRDELNDRIFELSILYDISNSISYTLNYEDFLKIMADSLHRIIDYDLCSSLLTLDGEKARMIIRAAHPVKRDIFEEVKHNVISSLNSLRPNPISEREIEFEIRGEILDDQRSEGERIVSSFDVPLFVRQEAVGILNVAAVRDIAYSDEEIKLLYTLASQASAAIERLQAVLSAEKSKMKVMVERMSEGVAMFDEKDELVIANSAFKEMTGGDLSLLGELDEIKKRRKQPKVLDIHLEKPFPRIINSESACIEDDNGRYLGIVVLLRDVSKEREIEQMKSDFVSLVSHELRTPLVAIKGAADNLLDGLAGELNDTQKDCLVLSKRNIDRLNRLISDLLDISRIEAGKIQLNKQPADAASIVKDVLGLFQASAKEKNIALESLLSEELPLVTIDSDKINQVLTNLVGNALKFTPAQGKIIVKVFRAENFLRVEVKDTGVGIPKQDLEKVFDKFYQVDRNKSFTSVKGTGLGLPISKGIVERHGGKIWAESEAGQGSKFIFTLPVVRC